MSLPTDVTRTAVVKGGSKETSPYRLWHQPLCALLILTASALPASAQTRTADQAIEPQHQEPDAATAPSAAALERIRRALALQQRPTELPGLDGLALINDEVDRRPAVQLLPGFDVVGGLNLFGLVGSTGRQLGPPTHQDMLNHMMPREMREAGGTDVLGITSVSAVALGLPYVIKAIGAIGDWLFGDDDDGAPEHPILTESEETRALAGVTADSHVLEAGISQRGRTVALSLVVRADTPPDTARALGAQFVRLVKTYASAEPDPEQDVGAGDYDYIVRVSSPTESVIALGGKATTDTRIHW